MQRLFYVHETKRHMPLAEAIEFFRARYGDEYVLELIAGGNSMAAPDNRQGLLL